MSAVAVLVVAAVGLGTGNPDGVHYDTSAAAPPPEPPAPPERKRPAPPPEILFTGFIMVSDPTREAMGPDPWLWSESCQRLDIEPRTYETAEANLTGGSSNGELEDLDVYGYDVDGTRLATAANETYGLGTHHILALDPAVTILLVCLAGGSHASYELTVS